jgi:hypothetical protein
MQSKTTPNYEKIGLIYKGYASKIYVVRLNPDTENQNPNTIGGAKYQAIKKYFKKVLSQNKYCQRKMSK